MKPRLWHRLSLIFNVFLMISTTIIVTNGFLHGAGDGQLGEEMIGWGYFKAFTIDANILNGVIRKSACIRRFCRCKFCELLVDGGVIWSF